MGLANCSGCGKLYVENTAGICLECRIEHEKQAEKVLEYMRNISKATISEISEATGVKPKIILELMKRGALTDSDCVVSYHCEGCGKLIERGRFCHECSAKFTNEVKSESYRPSEIKYSQKESSKWRTQK